MNTAPIDMVAIAIRLTTAIIAIFILWLCGFTVTVGVVVSSSSSGSSNGDLVICSITSSRLIDFWFYFLQKCF